MVKVLTFFLALTALQGCVSHSTTMYKIRDAYRGGQLDEADRLLEESALKTSSNDKLLYLMEKAMIKDRREERTESRKLLLDADLEADNLLTTSVSKEMFTYLYNDSAQAYPGEDYEKVAIHIVMALSHLRDGNLPAARIAARKINTKLDEINDGYDEKAQNRYKTDAFALLLSGSIFESLREYDSAIIDYKRALSVYEGLYSKEFDVSPPKQLVLSLYELLKLRRREADLKSLRGRYGEWLAAADKEAKSGQKYGSVVLFHDLDLIASKENKEFFIGISGQMVRLSFPSIVKRVRDQANYIQIFAKPLQASDAKKNVPTLTVGNTSLVQNMDAIAEKTLDDRRARLVLKQGARLLVKGQLTVQADRQFGPLGGLAANIYGAVTETADTRSWTLLPGAFYYSRFKLPAGKYQLSITYPNGVIQNKEIEVVAERLSLHHSYPQRYVKQAESAH